MASVTNKTVAIILGKFLEDKKNINYDHAMQSLLSSLPDHAIELTLHILSSKEPYVPILKVSYVKLEVPYNHESHFNVDTMEELGLMCSNTQMVYAKVTEDGSWHSSYNPYYGQIKVNCLYHDDDLNLKYVEANIKTVDVIPVNKKDILYFKNLNHGKNKQTLTKKGDQELGINEEIVL